MADQIQVSDQERKIERMNLHWAYIVRTLSAAASSLEAQMTVAVDGAHKTGYIAVGILVGRIHR